MLSYDTIFHNPATVDRNPTTMYLVRWVACDGRVRFLWVVFFLLLILPRFPTRIGFYLNVGCLSL